MAAIAHLDRVTNLALVEKHGVVRSLTREARVIFDAKPADDFTILTLALAECPAALSTLADLGYESLILVERSPRLAEMDVCTVDVTLRYEHILDGPNQQVFAPTRGVLFGKGRCSIVERNTNFFYPPGIPRTLANRQLIEVAHTFPDWDKNIAGLAFDPTLPRTVKQVGEVNVPFPQANFQLQGFRTTRNPWATANQFIAKINENEWMSKPELTWICSEVSWECLDTAVDFYRFGFEFQYNGDTWNPTVVFNDQRTGRPPATVKAATTEDGDGVKRLVQNDLIRGLLPPTFQPAGYWTVPFLERVNFDDLFNSLFEGFPGAPE